MIMGEKMTARIIRAVSNDLSISVQDGLSGWPERFPYTLAFARFLETLKEYGIEEDFGVFNKDIREKIYDEFTRYLEN